MFTFDIDKVLFGDPSAPTAQADHRANETAEADPAPDDYDSLDLEALLEPVCARDPAEDDSRLRKKAEAQRKKAARSAKKAVAAEVEPLPDDVGRFAGSSDLPATLAEIEAATEVSIDLETTALSPWAPSAAPGSAVKMGNGLTVKAYARRYRCTIDSRPRARIVSLCALPNGSVRAFDLDTLSQSEREMLVSSLQGKVWVGHNLAFDLMWLRSVVPSVTPALLLDTMLLCITHAPDFEYAVRDVMGSLTPPSYLLDGGSRGRWRLPYVLGEGTTAREHMRTMLAQRDAKSRAAADDGEPGRALPLDFLSVALLGEKLDKAYQKPHNWTPGVLTAGHYDYCVGDISQPPKIARILLGLPLSAPTADVIRAAGEHPGGKAYWVFARAAVRLTQMQRNGLYMSPSATAEYVRKHIDVAEGELNALLADLPELAPYRADLLDPDKGLTAELKTAFADGLTRLTGVAPERTETGAPKLDAKALKMTYRDLPALAHYNALTGALKRASMARAYIALADGNSRLHSLVSIATVTGRTASQEPNLQNAPRGQDFRALFAAPPGKKIIAVDYSAIEMRIAAALTLRAYKAFRGMLDAALQGRRHDYEQQARALGLRWCLGDLGTPNKDGSLAAIDALVYLLRNGTHRDGAVTESGQRPTLEGSKIEDWRNYYAGLLYSVVAKLRAAGAFKTDPAQDRLALADVFARGLDPHMITALATESAAGRFDLAGATPTDFVAALSKPDLDALKKQLKGPRQAAKAQNFGLLYGMQGDKLHAYGITNYGLDWSPEEAVFAADAWFALYPEVRLWHLLTRNSKKVLFVDTPRPQKLFFATTLSGRPVCSDKLPSALNFQDQGTGAEIALAAIADLPDYLGDALVNFVHDELVFEVPADKADEYAAEIKQIMISAADRLLLAGFGVPTEVDVSVGDYWIH